MIERTCASGPATALATAPQTFVVATTVGVPGAAPGAPASAELPQPVARARTTRAPPAVRAARRAVVMGAPGSACQKSPVPDARRQEIGAHGRPTRKR